MSSVESCTIRRRRRCACITSVVDVYGEADWALRPLAVVESWPPKLFNTAYYKNEKVDADINNAQLSPTRREKAKLYKDAQETIWKDAPWAPLVAKNCCRRTTRSSPACT